MQVVLIGHVCIDENTSEASTYRSWGSAVMYMAHYLRNKLQIGPSIIAPYGKDFSDYVNGFKFVNAAVGDFSLLYRNFPAAVPRKWECQNTTAAEPVLQDDKIEHTVSQADIICLAPLLPNYSPGYVSELLAHKKTDALTVLQAAGYLRQVDYAGNVSVREFVETGEILPLFNLVFFSEDDHPKSLDLAQAWANKYPSTQIIVTQGAAGASLFRSNQPVTLIATKPVSENEIVDSVGCGDVFCAAAVHEYFLNRDLEEAIEAGNTAARAKLFHVGL